MKTLDPDWVTDHPDIAGAQIVILVTNETDVFITIPDVIVGNHHCIHYHAWRSHCYPGLEPPIRLNYAA
jgi:hypothetical protein